MYLFIWIVLIAVAVLCVVTRMDIHSLAKSLDNLHVKVMALENEVSAVSSSQIKVLGDVIAIEREQEVIRRQIAVTTLDRVLTPKPEPKKEDETVTRSRSWEVQRRMAEMGEAVNRG